MKILKSLSPKNWLHVGGLAAALLAIVCSTVIIGEYIYLSLENLGFILDHFEIRDEKMTVRGQIALLITVVTCILAFFLFISYSMIKEANDEDKKEKSRACRGISD